MMTLSKIAKLANVSVSTASKAFSGSTEVNEETRQMIFGIAKEQGCFKKFYNAKYQKLVIAVIAPEFRSVYYARYLSYIQVCLQKKNCELCVSTTDFSPQKEKDLIEYYYKNADVDGIILIDAENEEIGKYEIPIVCVNFAKRSENVCFVTKNPRPALEESIEYLLKKGVRAIGFIGEELTVGKLRLVQEILQQNGVTPDDDFMVTTKGRFSKGGYQAMEELFAKKKLPRAIICGYDYMAIGAIRCIYDHGLSVPEDVAVLGMDDIVEAEYLNPPLASISMSTEEICRQASEMIVNHINGEDTPRQITVDSVLKIRKSFEI